MASKDIKTLLRALNDPFILEIIDIQKLIKSAAFNEAVNEAILHCKLHGDTTMIGHCLEFMKGTPFFKSCVSYFNDNSFAQINFSSKGMEIGFDRSKIANGKPLYLYAQGALGSYEDVIRPYQVEAGIKKQNTALKRVRKAFNKVLPSKEQQFQEMASILKTTPTEYQRAIYRDMTKAREELTEEKKRGIKHEMLKIEDTLKQTSDEKMKKLLSQQIRKLNKLLTTKQKKHWSPILPGSYGSKQ